MIISSWSKAGALLLHLCGCGAVCTDQLQHWGRVLRTVWIRNPLISGNKGMEGNDLSFQVQLPASVATTKSQMILLREGEFAEKFWKEAFWKLVCNSPGSVSL
ncbi:hypothetical protein AV530_007412 [Patagioenas fasciata monilis]|uniref:Uncharacterized protein n=1 Tax=Patagioenas fasciata monilis TaxID=372326 RepID=A0A1V4JXZ4_PATFA|nr:hypothetical protein AV530_007412 [Patagioenas fasciata monilis]